MIGEIFKQVRKKKKLKQKDISISLGVTVNMVYRIQNSTNLVVKYSEKLSEIYGFNVLYLIPFASKIKSEKEVIIDSQIYKLIYDEDHVNFLISAVRARWLSNRIVRCRYAGRQPPSPSLVRFMESLCP